MMLSHPLARAGLTGTGLLLATWLPGWAAASGLNDTGVTKCGTLTNGGLTCPQSGAPRQDADMGRDAQAGLTKTGGGAAGFDFSKVCNSGQLAGQGTCPASPSLGTGTNNWACTRDNVTGLIWEIKTANSPPDLRDLTLTYTWCNNNSNTNGGNSGTCSGSHTEGFVTAVNALSLCGYTDWRMPTIAELQGLVDFSTDRIAVTNNPRIDSSYFPNTDGISPGGRPYWSATTFADGGHSAWVVGHMDGLTGYYPKFDTQHVRLVRGGQ